MSVPPIATVFDQIAWSYANLARAHAALSAGRTSYVRMDHIVRSRLFGGLQSGKMSIRSLYDDERIKMLAQRQCDYCGSTERLTIDHLVPRIKGGPDDGANLLLACGRCNSAKRDADLLAWYGLRGGFPPLLLLRRYLKLVFEYCENQDVLHLPIKAADLATLPFHVDALPVRFPALADLRL